MKKVGIFSGTFDPVHKGHIAFGLEAVTAAGLDAVYFLPEALPRRKTGVTHYAHRVAMLRLALKPYRQLKLLDVPDKRFSVRQTLPRLKKRFPDAELHLLLGSDALPFLTQAKEWPDAARLLEHFRLIVGVRESKDASEVAAQLQTLIPDRKFHVVLTDNAHASSRDIRSALVRGKGHAAALDSLNGYIKQHWLYAVIPEN